MLRGADGESGTAGGVSDGRREAEQLRAQQENGEEKVRREQGEACGGE